jgi:peptide/nickel transport system ATP-binding protein
VAIAIAFLHRPELIIADEPTTALDVTIQSQILAEMQKLAQQRGTALIWVSHDLTVLSGLADDIAVMYAGRIAESGTVEEVLNQPAHPYTRGLMDSVPSRNVPGQRIRQIPGVTPSLLNLGPGCAFRGRCFAATTDCTVDPPPMTLRPGHILNCYHPQLVASA